MCEIQAYMEDRVVEDIQDMVPPKTVIKEEEPEVDEPEVQEPEPDVKPVRKTRKSRSSTV